MYEPDRACLYACTDRLIRAKLCLTAMMFACCRSLRSQNYIYLPPSDNFEITSPFHRNSAVALVVVIGYGAQSCNAQYNTVKSDVFHCFSPHDILNAWAVASLTFHISTYIYVYNSRTKRRHISCTQASTLHILKTFSAVMKPQIYVYKTYLHIKTLFRKIPKHTVDT